MTWKMRLNWTNPDIRHVASTTIYEYDIVSAGATMLALSPETRELGRELLSLPKHERVVREGVAVRDRGVSDTITRGLQYAIGLFITHNRIPNDNVLQIKRDSIVFFEQPRSFTTELEGVSWRLCGTWQTYHTFDNGLVTRCSIQDDYAIKGLTDETRKAHWDFLLNTIRTYSRIEINDPKHLAQYASDLKREYLQFKMQAGCYREMNEHNQYRVRTRIRDHSVYSNDCPADHTMIDPAYNYTTIVLPLIAWAYR